MIKIITGWSNPGGSTVAHINLCNLFNQNGMDCILYGPHDWHLDKCRADKIDNGRIDKDDIIISHYIAIPKSVKSRKHIFSCHETNLCPINGNFNLSNFNLIHYVSNSQKNWHKVNYPYVIIPNVIDDLKPNKKPSLGIAGVIGSIDPHKRTHLSIEGAILDGYLNIYLYGAIGDENYFKTKILPYVTTGRVIYKGHENDKQKMYDSINTVYHSSVRETFNYIKVECDKTGTIYRGLDSANTDAEYKSKEEILELWKAILR